MRLLFSALLFLVTVAAVFGRTFPLREVFICEKVDEVCCHNADYPTSIWQSSYLHIDLTTGTGGKIKTSAAVDRCNPETIPSSSFDQRFETSNVARSGCFKKVRQSDRRDKRDQIRGVRKLKCNSQRRLTLVLSDSLFTLSSDLGFSSLKMEGKWWSDLLNTTLRSPQSSSPPPILEAAPCP